MNAVKVWCDDVYTSQVYFLTTHYCYQSIEFNDMLSQIRRLNTLLFNVRKNLPSVHTENNSASVIGHAGCRRRICDRSAEAGFSIFSLCLEAGLRPPAGRQLLLLAVAARWRCCHRHDGGVWLLIDARASGSSWCCPKNYVTQVRSSYAGKSQKLAKIVEPRVTNTSKITQHTVPKLVIFRRTYVPIMERSWNFGHLS